MGITNLQRYFKRKLLMRSDALETQTHEANIEDLKHALAQLRVAQERVSAVLNRIESERQVNIRARGLVGTLGEQSAMAGQATGPPQRRRPVYPLAKFTYGDPVFGATRSALVKIRNKDGSKVR